MRVQESKSVRHLVGRLERGESVLASLRKLARDEGVKSGWVSGLGAFEWVELAEYDQDAQAYRAPRRFDTPTELLSMTGNLSMKDGEPFAHVHVALSRETDNGIEVIGGHLIRAKVFALELRVDCFDDVSLVRGHDAATGLSLWGGTGSAPRSAPRSSPQAEGLAPLHLEEPYERAPSAAEAASPGELEPGKVSWAMAAAASEEAATAPVKALRAKRAEKAKVKAPLHVPEALPGQARPDAADVDDDYVIETGDWVEHHKFGLCRVEKADDDDGLLIKLPNNRRKLIKVTYLEVLAPRQDGERVIYPLRSKKKG